MNLVLLVPDLCATSFWNQNYQILVILPFKKDIKFLFLNYNINNHYKVFF